MAIEARAILNFLATQAQEQTTSTTAGQGGTRSRQQNVA